MKFKENDLLISSLFAVLMLMALNLYILLRIFPEQTQSYSSLGVGLPSLTIIFISIGSFVSKWMFIVVPLVIIDFITYTVLAFILKNKAALVKIYSITACGLLLFALLSVYAIRLPLTKINKVLSSTPIPAEVEKSNSVK
ncbi:MAG: hypothetical protein WC412_04330 [Candidatus Omnitrophota bacterium]|jgi:hypothetical protein